MDLLPMGNGVLVRKKQQELLNEFEERVMGVGTHERLYTPI
jgi:hypothetical protein